ncbi:hypothetical protein GUITHDRAFT_164338 [Guillardia theta CCMP2712]|uniref:Plant heme peroxidase family profile domain-containing protein n=1 Tax=Guillardia theta (strain CCMP2712) TaxID=905079 RepID=L1IZE7_GUITC|nr:hypothetical protein GUITHDRAFT_164338 [Guillardia theta CCMP2712]EKX41621.1 hypothetical protein GUITHDRAFT_164338 [Guillardia theta CCMP2712]|eukprot:XP_005828601.1 hypothetical protein GUITHDRAFT_164338 [Guillardia theta CCMP2712]
MLRSAGKQAAVIIRRQICSHTRNFGTSGFKRATSSLVVASAFGVGFSAFTAYAYSEKPDYSKVRDAVKAILDEDDYDDGSIGPILLAWHASGTYDAKTKTGARESMRKRRGHHALHARSRQTVTSRSVILDPPLHAAFGANAGLAEARKRLEPIKAQFPGLTYADLWILASIVAIEEMGGPKIPFRPGRRDQISGEWCPPDGRLPDADKGTKPATIGHVRYVAVSLTVARVSGGRHRDIFYRMGFNDQEIVALFGAHALGRCHTDRSGYTGPWTRAPTTFSNEYYRLLLESKWVPKSWKGPKQFENEDGKDLMMLPTDLALIEDFHFRKWVEIYAKDEKRFFADFAKAYQKLTELGCNNLEGGKGWF